jgi:hypothetical protein
MPPQTPALVYPQDGGSGTVVAPALRWHKLIHAADYHVQVSTKVNFSTTVIDHANVTDTTLTATNLQHNTLYYWRVRGQNVAGAGTYSDIYSFTTVIAPPAAPTLAAPANNAVSVSINPELKWNGVSGAASYHVQVANDANFTSLVVDQSAVISTWYIVNSLGNGTTFYWRVSASNAGGEGAFSATWQFSTMLTAIDAASDAQMPTEFDLKPVYPNPFNSQVAIKFTLPQAANVTLYILNARGQRVRTIANGMFAAGSYTQHWDSRDDHGANVSSGIYLTSLMTEGRKFTQKMILVR